MLIILVISWPRLIPKYFNKVNLIIIIILLFINIEIQITELLKLKLKLKFSYYLNNALPQKSDSR